MPPAAGPTGAAAPATLGIDVGTSSAKAVVLDTAGRTLGQATAGYPVASAQQGWAETDPGAWWAAVVASVREAVGTAAVVPQAIGLSGQMHGLVLADRQGAPLRPALLWADRRATEQLQLYRVLDPAVRARLANPLVAGMTGPLLAWIARHEPDAYARTCWAVQPKDWIRSRLSGQMAAEPSDASATLLYDVAGDRWDPDVVTGLGLDADVLAPLLEDSACVAGQLTPAAAGELGLPAGIPVAAGAADTAAAALGSAAVHPGDVQLTVGTGAQVLRPLLEPVDRSASGVHLYRSTARTGWYHMAATVNAGLSLNWVRETLGCGWAELYASLDAPTRAADPLFVPHLSGERTPYLDPTLRASWTGLSLTHDRSALLRSALEGVAYAIGEALDALVGAERPGRLRLAGGGTLAAGWRQLLADVLGVPLFAVDTPAASGRGAALLGAQAAGLLSYDEVVGPLAPPVTLAAEPVSANATLIAERRARFRRTVLDGRGGGRTAHSHAGGAEDHHHHHHHTGIPAWRS